MAVHRVMVRFTGKRDWLVRVRAVNQSAAHTVVRQVWPRCGIWAPRTPGFNPNAPLWPVVLRDLFARE
jgi:hypothetical protein